MLLRGEVDVGPGTEVYGSGRVHNVEVEIVDHTEPRLGPLENSPGDCATTCECETQGGVRRPASVRNSCNPNALQVRRWDRQLARLGPCLPAVEIDAAGRAVRITTGGERKHAGRAGIRCGNTDDTFLKKRTV